MIRSGSHGQLEFPDFYLPFSGHLDPGNRWISLSRLIPWKLAAEIYAESLCDDFGAPALPVRVALGALLIKERLGLTDRETVEAIRENPYLQFFIGYEEFTQACPFDPSVMVDFRKRFGKDGLDRVSEAIALASISSASISSASTSQTSERDSEASSDSTNEDNQPPADENQPAIEETSADAESSKPPANQGKLIVDATCAPADIRYPTDVSLVNEAREKTDELIDELHTALVGRAGGPPENVSRQSTAGVCGVYQKETTGPQGGSPRPQAAIGLSAP